MQEVLAVVLSDRDRRLQGEVTGGTAVAERLHEEPSRGDEEEWDRERERHLFRAECGWPRPWPSGSWPQPRRR